MQAPRHVMTRRFFSSVRPLLSHENPLGLPRKGTPPNLAARMQRGLPQKQSIRDVRKVIAISSAKGGVGKSTIAANLALAFARHGHRTGLLDTDIFGPSVPTLFDLADAPEPRLAPDGRLLPLTNYGVRTMSMGYLTRQGNTPTAWRGLMVMKALQQLLLEVDWGGLDVLLLDLPPGTGDTQLSVAQLARLDGAVVVSTPQTLALLDTLKGVELFRATGVPLLGLVQNMGAFTCPCCGTATSVFGATSEGRTVAGEAARLGVDLLAELPLDADVCRHADVGKPTVVADPESKTAKTFMDVAGALARKVDL